MKLRVATCCSVFGLVAGLFGTAPALAQSSGGVTTTSPNTSEQIPSGAPSTGVATPAQAEAVNQLQDIVVTAQKRGQNLQDVPLSVSAFTGATLAAAGITNALDVQQVDPSLNISMGGGGTAIPFMRGVGNPGGITIGNESSVPLYIDDIYYSRVSNAYLDLANVERVEVLKGPQGTLFGRNASAGLINIFTRSPNRDHIVADLTAGYGNYDTVTAKAYLSTPIGDRIATDLSVSYKNQHDGWGKNVYNGHDVWKEHYVSLRSKTIVDVTDSTQLTLIGWYVNEFTQQGSQYTRVPGSIGGTPDVCNTRPSPALCPTYGPSKPLRPEDNGSFYNINVAYDPSVREMSYGGSIKLDQDLNFADFVSISSYRRDKEKWLAAGDISPFPYLGYFLYPREKDFTQEFQLKSKAHSAFDWIVGAFYFNSKAGYDPTRVFGDIFGAGSSGPDLNHPTLNVYEDIVGLQTINSYSAYSQATFHVIPEGTNVTLGLRYNIDRVRGFGSQDIIIPAFGLDIPASDPNPFRDHKEFRKLTYKVVLDHKFAQDTLGYASISRGYKSGTYNTLPLAFAPTNPEVVESYELGLKTELLDKRLRLNVAVYQNDVSDPQVQVIKIIPPSSVASVVLVNAGSARSRGAELSGQYLAAPGLNIRFAADYLDAKFRNYQGAPFFYQLTTAPYGLVQCDNAVITPQCPKGGNAKGQREPQSPKFKANIGVNYLLKADFGNITFDTGVSYTSSYFWAPDNNYKTKAFALWDGSISFTPAFNEHLGLRVWGKNLTSHHYVQTVLENAGDNANSAAPAAPRTFGMELNYKF